MESYPSRFAQCRPWQAWSVIALTAAALAWCLFVSVTQDILTRPSTVVDGTVLRAKSDSIFHLAIAERVRAGQNYYDAWKEEFDRPFWSEHGGLRPTSLFHWRLPVFYWVLALLPGEVARKLVITMLAALAALMIFRAVRRSQGPGAAVLTFLLIGPFAWCVEGPVYLHTDLWAGVLIALSVAAYALDRWPLAVGAALMALFFRELALPYCLLCVALAVWRKRRAEFAAWVVGLSLFALFFAWHAHQVRVRIAGEEDAQVMSWIRFGGTVFALETTQMGNVFLIAAPAFLAAAVLPLALLGLAGWRGDTGTRAGLTCAGYLAFFLVAGRPANAYWGLLIGPLLMLGLTALPNALRDLYHALSLRA